MNIFKRIAVNLRDCCKAMRQAEPLPIVANGLIGRVRPMSDNLKRLTLRHYARRYELKVFVETGTFRGDTLAFMLPVAAELHSIELSPDFYAAAKDRFRKQESVRLYFGDSGEILKDVLPEIRTRALIWLDAHYSGKNTAKGGSETPILAELNTIFTLARASHIIFVDDSHYFGTNPDYPSISEVEMLAKDHGYTFEHRYGTLRLFGSGKK